MYGEDHYIFGFEESYGYLPEIFARDKDVVSTSLLICEMAVFYKKNKLTLLKEPEKLYEKSDQRTALVQLKC